MATVTQLGSGPAQIALVPKPRDFLAGFSVPIRAWEGVLARSFARLLSSPPRNVQVFKRALAHASHFGDQIHGAVGQLDVDTSTYTDRFPLATTFIRLRSDPTPLETTLAWLLLELHLRGVHDELVRRLAEPLRGLSAAKSGNKLQSTIGECDGLEHLVRKMGALKPSNGIGVITGLKRFDAMWADSLEGICRLLIQREVAEPDEDGGDGSLLLNSPDTMFGDPLQTDPSADAEDGAYFLLEGPWDAESVPASFAKHVKAWTGELYRRSSPELFRDPESIGPMELVQREWSDVLAIAHDAISGSNIDLAEKCLIHLLAIETATSPRLQ